MANVSLLVSAILIPLSSFLIWLPWSAHVKLFYPSSNSQLASALASNLNLDSCSPLQSSASSDSPQWCSEVRVNNASGWAYFACDDTRPWWDPVRHLWQTPPADRRGGSIWAWNIQDADARPFKLQLATQYTDEPFHPISISIVRAKEEESDSDNSSNNHNNLLLISNHPQAHYKGVVDIFSHSLASAEAVHYRRVEAFGLAHQTPYRIEGIPEQWSEAVKPAVHGETGLALQLPSFIFTALGSPCETEDQKGSKTSATCGTPLQTRAQKPTITQYLWDVLWASRLHPSPRSDVFIHIASGYTARSLYQLDLGSHAVPPLVRAWDGGGSLGGSNSTFLNLLTISTSLKSAVLEQWDQHWVRGEGFGVETVTNPKTFKQGLVRWPSFVTFWNHRLANVVSAHDVDRYGRIWTAGPADQGKAWALAESLAQGRDAQGIKPEEEAGALVHQATYVHRVGPSVGHPWEVERLGNARRRGLWLPKEFYSSLVYRRGVQPSTAVAAAADLGDGLRAGYLPGAPTGIAVDEERKQVIVTSSWQPLAAVCKFKEGYVEE